MTQKNKIYNYLRDNPQWFKSYELQAMALKFEASPATVDRRLRELALGTFKNGKMIVAPSIDRRRIGRYEQYRVKQTFNRDNYTKPEQQAMHNEKLFDLAPRRIML